MSYNKPLKLNSNKQEVWFTSDTHFGHKNIIKLTHRPFNSVEEMDSTLINNWNSVVQPNDLVFHLGDFAYANPKRWKALVQSLNGQIHLIIGNHDELRYPGHEVFDSFFEVYNQLTLKIDDKTVYLNHYPFLCYGGTYSKEPVYQLYGHVHSGPKCTGLDKDRLKYAFPYQYDVGVDNNNYFPISWQDVVSKIKENIISRKEAISLGRES